MLEKLVDILRRQRNFQQLQQHYTAGYAFVGIGSHSRQNLYPIVGYLGLPLRYICVTSERKAQLIATRFPQIKATTSLDEILNDDNVKGVLIATSPQSNFAIARRILQSGRTVFVEKPPCLTATELEELITAEKRGNTQCVVGLQKRYAPAVQTLRKQIEATHKTSYTLHYRTGLYPEGNALTDLFIHPLDLVTNLFGAAELNACQSVTMPDGGQTLHLQLRHAKGALGSLELSTAYTWTEAEERLVVNTCRGIFELHQTEQLTYSPKSRTLFGIPIEKIRAPRTPQTTLVARNSFSPLLKNNPLYTQGFYDEITCFARLTEGLPTVNLSPLESLRPTYALLEALSN